MAPPALLASPLTRRAALGGFGAAALAGLAGCASGGSSPSSPANASTPNTEPLLNVSNWTLYIDKRKGSFPTVEAFEQETGIEVTYSEEIADNEEFFAKIRPQLAAGVPTGRDLMVLTDWMAARLVNLGYLEEIDHSNIPHGENLLPSLQSPPFDPERRYSMPWQSGFTALAYNSDVVQTPVRSMTDLLTRPDLKGRVAVFTEMRDTTGLIMLDQGLDPSSFTDADFDQALAVLQDAVDRGQIRQFADANYGQALAKGDLAATMTYSGDVNQLQLDNPTIELVVPEAGFMLWSDNMLIPRGAEHKANAERWMDWYYRPEVAAQVAGWVNFISPVQGAQEELAKTDPDLAENPLIFPSPEDLAAGSIFRALSPEEDLRYSNLFSVARGL